MFINYKYSFMKKNNFLKSLVISCLFLLAQTISAQIVKGKVVGTDGSGLPYINVLEKGTSNGVSTDDQGMFSVDLTKMPATLVFSSQAPYEIPNATVVDYSINLGPLESFTLPSFEAEGDYSISIVPYQGFTAPIECNLIIVAGDMAYDFTGSVASGQGASGGFSIVYNTVDEFAACVKIGTGATSTYTAVNKL